MFCGQAKTAGRLPFITKACSDAGVQLHNRQGQPQASGQEIRRWPVQAVRMCPKKGSDRCGAGEVACVVGLCAGCAEPPAHWQHLPTDSQRQRAAMEVDAVSENVAQPSKARGI